MRTNTILNDDAVGTNIPHTAMDEPSQLHVNGEIATATFKDEQQLNSENDNLRTLKFGGTPRTLPVMTERRGLSLRLNWGAIPVTMYIMMFAIVFFALGWLSSAVYMNNQHSNEMKELYERMITTTQVQQELNANLHTLKAANAEMSILVSDERMKAATAAAQLATQIKQTEVKVSAIAPLVSRGSTARNYDLTQSSHTTAEEIDAVLKDTGLAGLGSAFIKAEKDYNVNALFLIGIAMNESGNGTSKLAKTKNNLFGWQAYDSDTSKARTFATKAECIDVVASSIKKNYLTPGGSYFYGYTTSAVNIRYASDVNWDTKVTSKMTQVAKKIGELRTNN